MLASRATDAAGHVQPEQRSENAHGYATRAGPTMRSRWPSPEPGGIAFAGGCRRRRCGRGARARCRCGARRRAATRSSQKVGALFIGGTTPPCAICHTLKDAGATGAVGPVLDELRPDEERVVAAVRGGIGAMPSFAATLSDAQIRALARYVAKASGGAR